MSKRTDRQAPRPVGTAASARGAPFSLPEAQIAAERGFHVLLQSCRGTFGSGGRFEPMRREASDGQDTVAWLRDQSLAEPVETVGDVTAELHVTRDNPNADLCDVDPPGDAKSRSRNVCDGFARNPGNGQVDAAAKDFVATGYSIDLSASSLVLSQTAGKESAHA